MNAYETPAGSPGTDFNSRLKTAVAGDPGASLVFLGNFEVEEQWARGETGLPRLTSAGNAAVVNRMDEFALLLGGAGDHVVLKTAPDSGYLSYLSELGITLPDIHVVANQLPGNTVTQDALSDGALLGALGELGASGAAILAHGVSELEEELAAKAGIPLAAPSAKLSKAVNSKIYSRQAADELGLRQPHGWTCSTIAELDAAVAGVERLDAGTTVLLKEAYGVSGKGISVVDSAQRLRRLARMISSSAKKAGTDRISFVVEERVAMKSDLNYQITVGRDGAVHLDFVKEALTRGGVHLGHRFPPGLTDEQGAEIHRAAYLIGAKLAADGFFGVAGVDAMTDPDGGIYPVVEINARNNMSTYQTRLQEHVVGPGRTALARHYPLSLAGVRSFDSMRQTLDGLLLRTPGDSGLLVNNFATVNAGAVGTETFNGRLYGLVVGESQEQVDALDAEIMRRLQVDGGHSGS